MDPLSLILLVLCVVLVGGMWAALVSVEQVAERVRIRAAGDDVGP